MESIGQLAQRMSQFSATSDAAHRYNNRGSQCWRAHSSRTTVLAPQQALVRALIQHKLPFFRWRARTAVGELAWSYASNQSEYDRCLEVV